MLLTIHDVARLCSVGESRVFKWVQEDGLPAEQLNGAYRVNPTELLEWATHRKLPVSPAIFRKLDNSCPVQAPLTDALQAGGVLHNVPGEDRELVLAAAVETLPVPDGFDRATLVRLLVARENLGGTAIGDGIAIPHPRSPVVLVGASSVVRLCFLTQPLDLGAPDGRPVDVMFLMISPTVRDHLQLLSCLAMVLRDESFRRLLHDRPPQDQILQQLRRIEESFQGSA